MSDAFEQLDGLAYVVSPAFQDDMREAYGRWDREWLRYLSAKKDYAFFFYDMSGSTYALAKSPSAIALMTAEEFHDTILFKDWPVRVWASGADLVGKTVVEMGCGPGSFGRVAGRFVSRYIGIDTSRLALHVAQVASPGNCTYIHMSETDALRSMAKSADICIGRHFLIHHNYDDALWILRFLRDLTKAGGLVSADFYSNEEKLGQPRRYRARDPLDPEHASALFHFDETDIREIAAEAGLEVVSVHHRPDAERHFAMLKVR